MTAPTMTAYKLDGRLFEACNCNVICPCWIGEDPDNGTCDGLVAWHIDQGEIEQVDVSNLTLALATYIPGNILKGNWRVVAYMDDKAVGDRKGDDLTRTNLFLATNRVPITRQRNPQAGKNPRYLGLTILS